jgi:hypothetical protein
MPKSTVQDEFAYNTLRAGEITRQLGLAGLGAVWLFHVAGVAPQVAQVAIPGSFRCAVVLIVAALFIDGVQYLVGTFAWRRKLKATNEEAATHSGTVSMLLGFIALKTVVMMLAYGFLLFAMAARTFWST